MIEDFAEIKFKNSSVAIPARKIEQCFCRNFVMDDDIQLLVCRNCGKLKSPYQYLREKVGELGVVLKRLKSLDVELTSKRNQLLELKRQAANTKARIRNLNKQEIKP